jgi:hypothetical protein
MIARIWRGATRVWESFEAIARFAGEPVEKARYYPEDEAFLLELTPEVEHYELAVRAGSAGGGAEDGGAVSGGAVRGEAADGGAAGGGGAASGGTVGAGPGARSG